MSMRAEHCGFGEEDAVSSNIKSPRCGLAKDAGRFCLLGMLLSHCVRMAITC